MTMAEHKTILKMEEEKLTLIQEAYKNHTIKPNGQIFSRYSSAKKILIHQLARRPAFTALVAKKLDSIPN